MVTSATSLGRNGLSDWLIQRVTAVLLGLYTLGMLGFFLVVPEPGYATWSGLMGSLPMQIVNTLVLGSIAAHGWVGLWTVATDYLTTRKMGGAGTAVRLVVEVLIALALLVYVIWGLVMIWGGA
jgi:succinate dehydrogenase / fumarate reductase membrane anchor subunit